MMTTFLPVHGAWRWDRVVGELKSAGHVVRVPELPGHGKYQTLVTAIWLDSYVETVASEVGKLPGNVALVGHSMAGVVISQRAERMPERIAWLRRTSAKHLSWPLPRNWRHTLIGLTKV